MNCKSNVEEWVEYISSLSDAKFFDIMRLYLGEIQTPYNKQRLIEQLAGFIRNETNAKNIISLIDDFDIKVITALSFIPNATEETLIEFFAEEYTMVEIYGEISNLITRLIVFEQKEPYSEKKYLRINPLLWNQLEKYIKLSNIVKPGEILSPNIDDIFSINPNFILSFISFINFKGCSCKADGEIKKNDLNKIGTIFSGKVKTIQLLLKAFINLNLVVEGEKSLQIDKERCELFASLENKYQYSLICAASCSRFSRDGLKKEAQLFLDTICSISDEGFTRRDIVRLAFLVGTNTENGKIDAPVSRFSKMLEAARQEASIDAQQAGSMIDRMIDSAIEFGILQKKGINEQGSDVYVCNQEMKSNDSAVLYNKVLNIDSTYTVSLMPGLDLKTLLPFSEFLAIKNYGVVTEFEITRQSISDAFDKGWLVDEILEKLESYSNYEIPQNLKITIGEWYNSYSSAMIYKGYFLKVAKNNIQFVENNPNIKKYIKEKLAEGIYLLNVPITNDISYFIQESGLDFMGKVKNPFVPGEKIKFPVLRKGCPLQILEDETKENINFAGASELLNGLRNELDKMNLSKNQKECLSARIHQRLIINKAHLLKTSVRIEILEADGMDFSGKIHLFEAGLKENDTMELTMPSFNKENEYFKVVGKPLGISKQTGDAVVRFEVYPDHEVTNFVVSRITYLRRLRF